MASFFEDPLGALGLGSDAPTSATPEPIDPAFTEQQRKLAIAMLESAGKDKITNNASGINHVLKSMIGAYQHKQADKAEAAGKKEANDLLTDIFGGGAKTVQPVTSGATSPSGGTMDAKLPFDAGDPLSLIKAEEGFAPTAKWDKRQFSGGYGSKAAQGETFTRDKAEEYLRRDAAGPIAWVQKNVPNATPGQRSALVSFGYNLGEDDLQKLLPDIQKGDWGTVGRRMVSYNKALNEKTGKLEVLDALTNRRKREVAIMLGGGAPAQNLGEVGASGVQNIGEVGPSGIQPQTSAPSQTSGAIAAPAGAVSAASNPNLLRAVMLLRNPRTAPIGQMLLQRALSDQSKEAEDAKAPPTIIKVPGPDGGEVPMVYDRATKSLKPIGTLMESGAGPVDASPFTPVGGGAPMPAIAPPAAPVAQAPAGPMLGGPNMPTENIGEVGASGIPQAPLPTQAVPAPVAAQPAPVAAAVDVPEGAMFGPQWKGKIPDEFVQRQGPGGRWLYDDKRQPLLELKSAANARAKADEKRGEATVEGEQQRSGVKNIITTARGLVAQPGFDDALRLNRADVGGIPIPYAGGEGINPAQAAYKLARATNPNSPTWGVMDDIKSTQERLKAVIARPLFKGQGQVSDSERKMITEMIGDLPRATSRADYQFRLNSIERMIDDTYSGKPISSDTAGARPTTSELRTIYNSPTPEKIDAQVGELAAKYQVPLDDMKEYVISMFDSVGTGIKPKGPEKKAQPSLISSILDKMGL